MPFLLSDCLPGFFEPMVLTRCGGHTPALQGWYSIIYGCGPYTLMLGFGNKAGGGRRWGKDDLIANF